MAAATQQEEVAGCHAVMAVQVPAMQVLPCNTGSLGSTNGWNAQNLLLLLLLLHTLCTVSIAETAACSTRKLGYRKEAKSFSVTAIKGTTASNGKQYWQLGRASTYEGPSLPKHRETTECDQLLACTSNRKDCMLFGVLAYKSATTAPH